jgi:hypothetical protein
MTVFTEHPCPKDLLESRGTSGGWTYEGPNEASHRDSEPSEARKRGSGGGSPRKYNDLITGRSDLDVGQGSYGAVPVRASRANRENGGLGEDPPGSTMTY